MIQGNGFLFSSLSNWKEQCKSFIRRVDLSCAYQESSTSALVWGNKGDVTYFRSDSGDELIFTGYLTETSRGWASPDRRRVVEYLHEQLSKRSINEIPQDFVDGLNGSFSIVYLNSQSGEILCISDRIASRPLWYRQGEEGWTISSNPLGLAALDRCEYHPSGLLSFLLYGGPVDPSRTIFSGITAVPAGSILRLGDDGLKVLFRWYEFAHTPDDGKRMSEWTEMAADAMTNSASQLARIHPAINLFFSGGVDSRLAASALVAAGHRPQLSTLSDGMNIELRVAKMAAKSLSLNHKVVVRHPDWYLERLNRSVFDSGGCFSWIHHHFSKAVETIVEEGTHVSFMLGDFCEAFSKLCFSVEHAPINWNHPKTLLNKFDALPLPLYRPQSRQNISQLFHRDIWEETEKKLHDEIEEQLEDASGRSSDPKIALDYLFRWKSAATIATFSMFLDVRSAGPECNIMFDKHVHQLLERLPSKVRNERNFGAQIMGRLNWRAGLVPNSNTLLPVCFPPAAHRVAKSCKPTLGKIRRTFLGDSHKTTGSWPKTTYLYANDQRWRKRFGEILNEPDSRLERWIDRNAVRRCWDEFLKGDYRRGSDVEKLVHLSLLSRLIQN